MTATMWDLKQWVLKPRDPSARWVIIACDTYDHDNYPIYVGPDENIQEKAAEVRAQNMTKIDEIYDLHEGDKDNWFASRKRVMEY